MLKLIQPRNKITIVGLGTSCYDWVQYQWEYFLPESEVWTINAGAAVFRHDIVFDMHTEEWVATLKGKTAQRVMRRREWLKDHDKPIVMARAVPELPTSITYPLREVYEAVGSLYFSTGIAYMLALAFACDVKELNMFGCDFSYQRDTNSHDEQGRACAEYWVGRLVQKGCKVAHSGRSHFMDMHKRSEGRIYGYHEPVVMDFPLDGGRGKLVGPDYA